MSELASQPTSIQSVYGWHSEDKLYVNRRYQRKLVWRLEEKQKLIESILKKYPIPAILIAEREGSPGTYDIIDGLQRLHAIVSFIETSFHTLDRRLFDLKYFPTAKSRADEGLFAPNVADAYISQRDVSTILDYSLAVSVMRNATEAEVNDVFDRINTYGHRLSDQERQAGVQHEFSSMVRTIAYTLRGDASDDVLPLKSMPSISIDLPMTKHGYDVVGVAREAKVLHITMEKYLSKWKDGIKNSQLSQHLKDCVMSNIDFNSFYGLGVIVITIPPQKELSYVGDELFWRNGDSTERVETPKQIAALAQRF